MLQVPVVLGSEAIVGWALPALGGGLNSGQFWVPDVNDFVWVEFEEGDPQMPLWSPGPRGRMDGVNTTPKHGRGETDDEDVLVRDVGIMPPTGFEGVYPNVRGWRTKAGHILEMDDTPDAERILFAHSTGSRREVFADGSTQEVSVGSYRRRIANSSEEEVTGNLEQVIGGNRVLRVEGDERKTVVQDTDHAYGNMTVAGKTKTESWSGDLTHDASGNYSLVSAGQMSIQSSGQFALMCGQNWQCTILETMEVAVSNATGVPLTTTGMLLQAYNSKMHLKTSDVTGLIVGGEIVLVPTPTPLAASVLLTGDGASEPFVLGNQMTSLLKTVLDDLATHAHPTGVGLSGPPVTAPVYTSASAQLPLTLSKKIMGS